MIHIEKRMLIVAKMTVAAVLGVVVAAASSGKIDHAVVQDAAVWAGVGLISLTTVFVRMTWTSRNALASVYEHLNKREIMDVDEVADYIKKKCISTGALLVLVGLFFYFGGKFIKQDIYFILVGATDGVLLLVMFQFLSHHMQLTDWKYKIESKASAEKTKKL
jgi:hypothetical protein